MFAKIERKFVGACSTCVETAGSISLGDTAISMYTCSKEPMRSSFPLKTYLTGRIMRERDAKRNKPGYCPPSDGGTRPISRSKGISWIPSVFHIRRLIARPFATDGVAHPMMRPSNCTHIFWLPFTEGAIGSVIPWATSKVGMRDTARGEVTMRHVRDRWLSRPHGDPSGVWTGHRKPGNASVKCRKPIRNIDSTPRLGKQLPHCGCLEFCEEGASMNTSEMADIPMPIQLFCNNSETCGLL
jgi:hypothetical protein